jgi:hypothetical protein
MSTLAITRNYSDGDDLTEAQLDAANDSIETWGNGNIGSTNIATGGVEATNLAALSVTAAKIASDAVTTAKILDGNVTGAKLAPGVVDDSTLAISSNQLIIKNSGVSTAKIADGAVTQAKRASLGQQLSSSSSTFSSTSASETSVTNLSVSITTTGRPVFVGLIPDGSTSNSMLQVSATAAGGGGVIGSFYVYRDSTLVGVTSARAFQGTNPMTVDVPVGSLWSIDAPSSGTYTYAVKAKLSTTSGNPSLSVQYAKLIAYEL